jgi:uncharacterized membrane protein
MKNRSVVISTAIGSLLAFGALGVGTAALAAEGATKEKCYGIAKSGQNDCAANGHACQGQAKTDNDPAEWKYVAKGECETLGGRTSPADKSGG